MVLTALEKGRVISHGEEPSLEEVALDKMKFMHVLGHIFPFGRESIFYINIKKMKSVKAYHRLLQHVHFGNIAFTCVPSGMYHDTLICVGICRLHGHWIQMG